MRGGMEIVKCEDRKVRCSSSTVVKGQKQQLVLSIYGVFGWCKPRSCPRRQVESMDVESDSETGPQCAQWLQSRARLNRGCWGHQLGSGVAAANRWLQGTSRPLALRTPGLGSLAPLMCHACHGAPPVPLQGSTRRSWCLLHPWSCR